MKQDQSGEKKRDRRLLAVAGGAFVLAACVLGGLYSQRNTARGETTWKPPVARSVPDLTPEQKAEYVERARLLRAKMEPWARQHRAELRRMMAGGPDGAAAAAALWKAAAFSENVGVPRRERLPTGDPTKGIGFGWYPLPTNYSAERDPDKRAMAAKIEGMSRAQYQSDVKGHHDLKLMGAGGGLTITYIWASGRITQVSEMGHEEYERMARRAYAEGRPQDAKNTQGPVQELVPPYDFLVPSTTN